MQRPGPLVPPLLLLVVGAALTGCSSGGGSGQAASSPAASVPSSSATSAVATSAAPASPAPTSGGAASAAGTSAAATSGGATSAPAGGDSVITFTGKVSGRMSATACSGGMAQLSVDIDGESTAFPGLIDAKDFTFVGPNSTGYTLAKGASMPRVSGGGTIFTVRGTKLIGILNDDTVTASGTVTCP